ncbi:hypothetical protein D3C81_259550 [compost metagenome]
MFKLGVEAHCRLLDLGAFFRQEYRLGLGDLLGEIQGGCGYVHFPPGGDTVQCVAWQTAVPAADLSRVEVGPQGITGVFQFLCLGRVEHIQWRGRWALAHGAFHTANPERIAWVFQAAIGVAVGFTAIHQHQRTDRPRGCIMMAGVVIALFFVLVVILLGDQGFSQLRNHCDFARHRRHGLAWQWNDGGNRCTGDDFAVRQGPSPRRWLAAAQGKRLTVVTIGTLRRDLQTGALFEHVMHPPHAPHALGKVRIEVAVIDGVACYAVAVTRATVGDLVGITDTRANALGINVVRVVVIGVEQPLVSVQVKDVLLVAVVGVAKLDEVANVTVVDVGRLCRKQRHGGLDANLISLGLLTGANVFEANVGRYVHQHGHVTDRVRAEEELFVGTRQAIMHGADAQAVGHHFSAHTARTVVDHERVAGRLQHMPHYRVCPVTGEGLSGSRFIGELRGEVAKRLQAIGDRRVALANTLQWVGRGRKAAIGIGPHDHGVGFTGDDLIAIDHGDDRRTGLAFTDPRFTLRVAGLVIDDRLAGRGAAGGAQAHFFFGQGVAVSTGIFWQHHHLTEQAVGDVTGSAFTAERGALAGRGERAFALGIQGIGTAGAWSDQEVAIAPGIGGNVANAVDRLHAVDLKAYVAVGDLFVSNETMFTALLIAFSAFVFLGLVLFAFVFFFVIEAVLVRVGLVGQEVLQIDG